MYKKTVFHSVIIIRPDRCEKMKRAWLLMIFVTSLQCTILCNGIISKKSIRICSRYPLLLVVQFLYLLKLYNVYLFDLFSYICDYIELNLNQTTTKIQKRCTLFCLMFYSVELLRGFFSLMIIFKWLCLLDQYLFESHCALAFSQVFRFFESLRFPFWNRCRLNVTD